LAKQIEEPYCLHNHFTEKLFVHELFVPSVNIYINIKNVSQITPFGRQHNNTHKFMMKMLARNGSINQYRPELKDYLVLDLNNFVIKNW